MKTTAKNDTETKPSNYAFVVHRSLQVQGMDSNEQKIWDCLAELEGMQAIDVDLEHARLKVAYDASKVNFGMIEKTLNKAGYPPRDSWWSRVKSSWYRYFDENAQTNAKSKGGACCSNPSNIYANRKK